MGMIVGLLGLLIPHKLEEHPWPAFVGIYLLLGHVRAVFRCVNTALFADFFPDVQAGAFAMLNVYSSVSCTAGYLVFALGKNTVEIGRKFGIVLVSVCVLSFITTPMAFYVHNRRNAPEPKTARLLDEYSLEYTRRSVNTS